MTCVTRLAETISKGAIYNILKAERHMHETENAYALFSRVISGTAQLWEHICNEKPLAHSITYIVDYDSGKRVLFVAALGGESHRLWAESADKAWEEFAMAIGADELLTCGRLGWSRTMEKLQWGKRSIVWVKPIHGGVDGE
jgi:phage FluMu gp28-like protein